MPRVFHSTRPKALLFLVKAALDKGFEFVARVRSIRSVRGDLQDRTLGRGEHHHHHDAFAVDLGVVFGHLDVGSKGSSEIDKSHRRPSVQAQPIHHRRVDFLPVTHRRVCHLRSAAKSMCVGFNKEIPNVFHRCRLP